MRQMLKRKSDSRFPVVPFVALGALFLAYTSIRAYVLSFTSDESYSFLYGVAQDIRNVFFLSFRDANNHPLNTWAMYGCWKMFGESELSLRLPNLVAHLLYLIGSALICRRMRSVLLAMTGFVILNANPMVLDYFSLARGYGMGLAFVMCSGWLLFESVVARSIFYAMLSIAAATLAILSNYSFIYYYPAVCAGVLLGQLWKPGKLESKAPAAIKPKAMANPDRSLLMQSVPLFGFILWNTFLMSLFVGREIMDLNNRGAFYLGKDNKYFWPSSIGSVMHLSCAGLPWLGSFLEWAVAPLLILGVFLLLRLYKNRAGTETQFGYAAMACVSILTIFFAFVIPYSGKANYLWDRAAIVFIPLIAYVAIFILNEMALMQSRRMQLSVKYACIVLIALTAANFLLSANFSHTPWSYDADTKQMLVDLKKDYDESGQRRPIRLGIDWLLEQSINFYRHQQRMGWLEQVGREGFSGQLRLLLLYASR